MEHKMRRLNINIPEEVLKNGSDFRITIKPEYIIKSEEMLFLGKEFLRAHLDEDSAKCEKIMAKKTLACFPENEEIRSKYFQSLRDVSDSQITLEEASTINYFIGLSLREKWAKGEEIDLEAAIHGSEKSISKSFTDEVWSNLISAVVKMQCALKAYSDIRSTNNEGSVEEKNMSVEKKLDGKQKLFLYLIENYKNYVDGIGSKNNPFVIKKEYCFLSTPLQAASIDAIFGNGTYTWNESEVYIRYYHKSNISNGGDLSEHRVKKNNEVGTVFFDLGYVTLQSRKYSQIALLNGINQVFSLIDAGNSEKESIEKVSSKFQPFSIKRLFG